MKKTKQCNTVNRIDKTSTCKQFNVTIIIIISMHNPELVVGKAILYE